MTGGAWRSTANTGSSTAAKCLTRSSHLYINFFIRTVIVSIINLILIFISSDVQVVQLGVAKTRDLHAIVSV